MNLAMSKSGTWAAARGKQPFEAMPAWCPRSNSVRTVRPWPQEIAQARFGFGISRQARKRRVLPAWIARYVFELAGNGANTVEIRAQTDMVDAGNFDNVFDVVDHALPVGIGCSRCHCAKAA